MRKKNKMAGESWEIPTDFIFLFIMRVVFFLWSELIRFQFYFIFICLFDPSWSESIRVDPTRTGGPSWSGPTFVPASSFFFFPLRQLFACLSVSCLRHYLRPWNRLMVYVWKSSLWIGIVYFKELLNEQDNYWLTTYRSGTPAVSTITSTTLENCFF